MTQVDRVRCSTRRECAAIALDHGQGVVSKEGRDGGLPFPFILQRSDCATQLVDCQDVLAGHRATLSAVDLEIAY